MSLSQCQSPPRIALEVRAVDGRALNHIEDGLSETKVLVREGTERGVGDLLRLNPRQWKGNTSDGEGAIIAEGVRTRIRSTVSRPPAPC